MLDVLKTVAARCTGLFKTNGIKRGFLSWRADESPQAQKKIGRDQP
jgi:hypothetical protein